MLLLNLAIFFLASLLLVKSASYGVRSIARIAESLRFSEFFIAFAIAGLISILPELFIGINAALAGSPEIGFGTIIGSNVADLTIVIGLVAIVGRQINADKTILKNNTFFIALTSLPVLLMFDGLLSRDDGIILIVAFLLYMYHLVRSEKVFTPSGRKYSDTRMQVLLFAVSMILLFVASHVIVDAAIDISSELLLPSVIVGLFLVSIGTTLPELTFSLRAVLARHKEIAFGDILGNVAADSTLSIGIVALISPVNTSLSIFATSMFFMVFTALLVTSVLMVDKKITWKESLLLFLIYAVFMVIELKVV